MAMWKSWSILGVVFISTLYLAACDDSSSSDDDDDAAFPYLENGKYPFGYLLNGDEEEQARLADFNVVVLELLDTPNEALVQSLHDAGVSKVLSYLNAGSLEDWREDYEDFQHLCLDTYENWEDECWMDLSSEAWVDHLVTQRAQAIMDQGADGVYIDNSDVYELYPTSAMRDGLIRFYQGLRDRYPDAWIIMQNGASLLTDPDVGNEVQDLLDGVGFEDVSYMPDFDASGEVYMKRDEQEHEQILSVLQGLSENLQVFTIDYTDDPEEMLDAVEISRSLGFTPFVGRVDLEDLEFYPELL